MSISPRYWYVANVSIIFDAPCLFSIQCLYVFHTFHMFSFVYWMFLCTNLITRCHRPVDVFYCFCISENLLRKYSRKGLKIHEDLFYPEQRPTPKETRRGGQGATRGCQARPHPRPRLVGPWLPWPLPPNTSSPIRCP